MPLAAEVEDRAVLREKHRLLAVAHPVSVGVAGRADVEPIDLGVVAIEPVEGVFVPVIPPEAVLGVGGVRPRRTARRKRGVQYTPLPSYPAQQESTSNPRRTWPSES